MTGKRLTIWKVSAGWFGKRHDCTLAGIQARCGGACCYSVPPRRYWPSSAANRSDHACHYMGPQGCTLAAADKPITCLLYPIRMRAETMVLHNAATFPNSLCAGNYGNGPPLIVAMEDSLVGIFGRAQYERVKAQILAGVDSFFTVPPGVLQALDDEAAWERDNVIPLPRSRDREAP